MVFSNSIYDKFLKIAQQIRHIAFEISFDIFLSWWNILKPQQDPSLITNLALKMAAKLSFQSNLEFTGFKRVDFSSLNFEFVASRFLYGYSSSPPSQLISNRRPTRDIRLCPIEKQKNEL